MVQTNFTDESRVGAAHGHGPPLGQGHGGRGGSRYRGPPHWSIRYWSEGGTLGPVEGVGSWPSTYLVHLLAGAGAGPGAIPAPTSPPLTGGSALLAATLAPATAGGGGATPGLPVRLA